MGDFGYDRNYDISVLLKYDISVFSTTLLYINPKFSFSYLLKVCGLH